MRRKKRRSTGGHKVWAINSFKFMCAQRAARLPQTRAVAILVVLVTLVFPSSAFAGDVTIMFGRGQLEQVDSNCQPVPNSVSLWSIATDLKSRGMAATLPVTASQIGTASNLCIGSSVYPTWSDLDTFRGTYGWSM